MAKHHLPGLAVAIDDGALWKIAVTLVPHPQDLQQFYTLAESQFVLGEELTFATSLIAIALGAPVVGVLAAQSDADRSHAEEFVTDSAITTKIKIKTKLAADHITSLGSIHVDTDKNGVVWLSGTARTQEAINNAVAMAKATENVRSVQSDIRVQADDWNATSELA